MDEKFRVWSEGRGAKSTAEDMLSGLGFDEMDDVKEKVAKDGVLYTASCTNCGFQWKLIVPWTEVAAFFIGEEVPETVPTRQGVILQPRCRKCGAPTRFLVSWRDVKDHVDTGVRSGLLHPKIYQATTWAR